MIDFFSGRNYLSGRQSYPRGQTALIVTILVFTVGTVIIGTVTSTTTTRIKNAIELPRSWQSYYTAEAGVEDLLLRVINSDYSYDLTETVNLGNGSTAVTVGQQDNTVTITSGGGVSNLFRKVVTTLIADTVGASFNYGIQVGEGGLKMKNNSVIYGNVFSNGNVIGSGNAFVDGDVIVAGGVSSEVDVEYTIHNADQFFATKGYNRDLAQSFTPSSTDTVSKVAVYLGKIGEPNDNLKIRIHEDNGGKPSKNSLTWASIPASSVGSVPSWVEIAFSDNPTLTAGTKYWIVLDVNTSSTNKYWNWRKDTSNGYAGQTAKYTNNCCSGNPSWTDINADLAFRVWLGGVPTRIEGLTIGDANSGTGRANVFVDTIVRDSSCPNQYCIEDNPTIQPMPFSAGVIQGWKNSAIAGGTCAPPICDEDGNLEIPGQGSATIGPLYIPGKLKLNNYASLTLTGTVFVEGEIDLNNNCSVALDSGYGSESGVLLGNDKIEVSNHCAFTGSGDPDSYIMLLSDYASGEEEAIDVNNNSTGVLYYASQGTVSFGNNSAAKSAVGYRVELKNNATITYDSGLLDLRFTSGPGGGFLIQSWQEAE